MKNIFLLLFISISTYCFAGVSIIMQQDICKGVVYGDLNEPLIGATVKIIEKNIGTLTDKDGNFTLSDVPIGTKIEISYVGYEPKILEFNGKFIKVILESNTNLNEVVVVGYGEVQKRAKMTNSIAKIDGKTITVGANANPAQALAGVIPGAKVYTTSGSPSSTPSIIIRGGTDYNGNNAPLIVVDGIQSGSLSNINPNDIESISVLKDAGATAIYGARAGNGVILVTTKSGAKGKASVDFNLKFGMNFYSPGYEICSDEDYLYYYRLSLQNAEHTLPGGNYSSSYESMLYATNQPGGIGRTELSDSQSYNILKKTEENAYLLDMGWKEMLDPVSDNYILYKNSDIMAINTRNPYYTQDYNVSINGGGDRGNYYVGLGYYKGDDLLKDSYYQRYNLTFNGGYKINKWLESNTQVSYIRTGGYSNPELTTTYFMNRGLAFKFVRLEAEDGTALYGTSNPTININANKGNFDRDSESSYLSMTQRFTVNILPELKLNASMNWWIRDNISESFNHAYYTSNEGVLNPSGSNGVNRTYASAASFGRYFNQTYTLTASYNKEFNARHMLNVLLGTEFYKSRYRYMYAYGYGAPTGDFADLSLTQNDEDVQSRSIDSSHAREALLSYFFRGEYSYLNKYLLSATIRTDGYSRLMNHKWGIFPGISVGWIFSKEDFWKDLGLDWLSFGKIRASFGLNATINSSYLGYYTLQGSYSAYKYDGKYGYRISGLPNPDLSWEKTQTAEGGLDLGFLNNRFNLSLLYYNRLTKDKYAALSLPQTTGFSSVTYNNGIYQNQGIEIEFNGKLLDTHDFSWSLGANISYNNDKIIKLPDNGLPNNRQGGTEVFTGNGEETYYVGGYQEGQNPYSFVGYGVVKMLRTQAEIDALGDYIDIGGTQGVGVYANESGKQRLIDEGYTSYVQLKPGDFLYEDRNGDNKVEPKDRKIIGNMDPKWTGGFNTTLQWKNWSIYTRFDMSFGFDVYESNIAFWLGEGQGAMAFSKEVRDTWTPDNPNAKYPRVVWAAQYGTDNYIRTNSFFVQKGNYLACRELKLSYTVPKNICNKLSCQNLEVSITGQNLGFIKSCTIPLPDNTTYTSGNTAGYGGTYNLPRILLFGLNVKF